MSGIPVFYDYVNQYNANFKPSTMHSADTGLSNFFRKYLLQRAFSVFKWEIPEHWSKDYLLYTLYCFGHFAVINTDKFGVIPQMCGLHGYDVFYRPNRATITNPLLSGLRDLQIGKQCIVFKLNPDYSGIMDLVAFYGDMMALCAQTAITNTANSKLSYVFFAKNKSGAESYKKMYDKIFSGEPAVVIDKDLMNEQGEKMWDTFSQDVKSNYIAGDVMRDLRKWEMMFDTAAGIPNANTEKKERLISDEVNANNNETKSNCEIWLEGLQKSCAEVEKMFNIKMWVDWRKTNGENVDSGLVPVQP